MIAEALALIALAAVPAPLVIPQEVPTDCPGRQEPACTWPDGPIYVNPARATMEDAIHELGHHFDYQRMDDTRRDKFRLLVGDSRPWRAVGGNSPHEKFAEAYTLCVLKPKPFEGRVEGGYNYHPRLRRHRRICQLIARAG